ncbi:MAG: PAC2 family protein [Infirmifilum sp.]
MRIIEKGKLKIILNEDLKARYLITGFHGIGHVGWISVRHLVEKNNAARVGHIISPYMQPFVSIRKGVKTPYELYKAGETLFFLSNIPLSARDTAPLTLELAELSLEVGVEEAILFGGLDNRFKEDDSVRLAPTSQYFSRHQDLFNNGRFKLIDEGLGVVGPLAMLLSVYEAREIPAVAILPYAAPDRPDPKAAADALRTFNEIYGFNIPVDELIEEGTLLEKELEEVEKKMKQMIREKEPPVYHV